MGKTEELIWGLVLERINMGNVMRCYDEGVCVLDPASVCCIFNFTQFIGTLISKVGRPPIACAFTCEANLVSDISGE